MEVHQGDALMRFDSVQVLRAFAANLVVLSHLIGLQARLYPSLNARAGDIFGAAGVHCFFVISGFVIIRVALANEGWLSFLRARLLRIYPIYWVYLVAMILFAVAWHGEKVPTEAIIKSIVLWPEAPQKILPVAWSLVHEMYFYLVVVLFIVARVRMAAALAAWALFILVMNALMPVSQASNPVLWTVSSPYTLEFIAGGVLSLFSPSRHAKLALAAGLVLLIAGFAAFLFSPQGPWAQTILLGLPYVFIVYGATSGEQASQRKYPAWLVLLGDASYSIYLSHMLVVAAASRMVFVLLPSTNPAVLIFSATLCWVAANLWGVLSFELIERRIMSLGRRVRRSKVLQAV